MLIFREFFKTQFDQNIPEHIKLHKTFKIFSGIELAYAPEPPSIYVQL